MPRIEHLPGESLTDTLRRFQSQRPRTPESDHRERLLQVIQQTPFDKLNRDVLFGLVEYMVGAGIVPNGTQD